MRSHRLRWILLFALFAMGVFLAWWRPLAAGTIAAYADDAINRPLGIAAAIALQILLFALALPGSLMLWAVAPFHNWPAATTILTAGSVGGALGGYGVAGWLGAEWRHRLQGSPPFRILARNGGFLAQCALRALPGFPHSVMNYGGGLLGLPLPTYIAAAVIGLGLKSAVFAHAVGAMVTAATAYGLFRPATVGPLAALALLLGLGAAVRARWGGQG
ncbi:VTT domain-containing protein [Thiohalorhabdus sp.]|uniref:VTT domain-containing protein n=1 Tax=Thiohalorhabdus sp. TaxID=3094134 RepID=UPI002FC35C49